MNMLDLGIYATLEISGTNLHQRISNARGTIYSSIFNWYESNFEPLNSDCHIMLNAQDRQMNVSGMDSKTLIDGIQYATITLTFYSENAYNLFKLAFDDEDLKHCSITRRWNSR